MKKLLLMLAAALAAMTSCSAPESPAPLTGEWNVAAYSSVYVSSKSLTPVAEGATYRLSFHDGAFFALTTDCNTITGEYVADADSLRFINACATEMACESEEVERSFKALLPAVAAYGLSADSTLSLLDNRADTLMILRR